MIHRQKAKPKVFHWEQSRETDVFERLRYAAACKLCTWHEHGAGGGSLYIKVGDSLTLRFADHENTSAQYDHPDFNFVDRDPTEQEIDEIVREIVYPELCKKTAFALHVGLTVPKLKGHLTPECFDAVCENEEYPNTFTQYVVVATAFRALVGAGFTERVPVRQELCTSEDYCGR